MARGERSGERSVQSAHGNLHRREVSKPSAETPQWKRSPKPREGKLEDVEDVEDMEVAHRKGSEGALAKAQGPQGEDVDVALHRKGSEE